MKRFENGAVLTDADGPLATLEMDSDGYPTDETLEAIRTWPFGHLAELFDEVARIWHWGYGIGELLPAEREVVHADDGDRFLRLATGGWSGNEDIIGAISDNIMAQQRWRLSASGGLHIYEYPVAPQEKE